MKADEEGGAIIEETVQKAVEFHGHLGPFLVLGVRMGLLAKKELFPLGDEGMKAVAKTGNVPSLSCLLDGIQISTGCTMGNGKISAEPPGIPEAEFSAGDKMVTIRAKDEVVDEIKSWRDRYATLEEVARSIQVRSDDELFDLKSTKKVK